MGHAFVLHIFLLLISMPFPLLAQLNCKTVSTSDSIITRCYHENRALSTVESWQANKYWGKFIAYDKQGQELVNYSLRRVGGHASVYLKYHSNGQLSRCDYSSAPDGGIQFYKSTIEFDATGNKTNFWEQEYPDKLHITVPYTPEKKELEPEKIQPPKPEKIWYSSFCITNETNKKVHLLVKYPSGKSDSTITLKPGKEFVADTLSSKNGFVKPENGVRFALINKSNQEKRFHIVTAVPEETGPRRSNRFFVLERR